MISHSVPYCHPPQLFLPGLTQYVFRSKARDRKTTLMWSSLVSFVSQLMGNQFGQFCHALKQGQCNKAEDMYFNTKKLREAILLKVNEPLGPEHDNNSVLHYVAQHKMQKMYVELLNSDRCPGVPDLKNGHRRNCFHLICLNGTNSHAALSMLEFTVEFLRRQKVDVAHLLAEKDQVHQVLKSNLSMVALTWRPHAELCGLLCPGLLPRPHSQKEERVWGQWR